MTIAGVIIVTNYFFTRWFIGYARSRSLTDIPNERSSHVVPTPSSGGLGFVLFTLLGWAVWLQLTGTWEFGFIAFLIVSAGIALLGGLDDIFYLSNSIRFFLQSFAAGLIMISIGWFNFLWLPFIGIVELGILGVLLTWFWIVGMSNVYNFMDGIDGIASIQAIGCSFGWLIFSSLYDLPELFVLNLFLISSIFIFLLFNWQPARIFMGDIGSLFLGFSYAIMPIIAIYLKIDFQLGYIFWIGIILLWPFLFDGAFTLIRRLLQKENIFRAHRSHLYQRLNLLGWSHATISKMYLIFTLMCVFFSIWFTHSEETLQTIILFVVLLISLFYANFVERKERLASVSNE